MRLDQYIKKHAERVPDKPCINYYGKVVTWGEMDAYVDRLAAWLSKSGIGKGDAVAVYMQNCPQFCIVFYAIQRIGATVAPCSPMFKEWELAYEVGEVGARILIANSYLYPIIEKALPETKKLEKIVLTAFSDFLPEEPELPFTQEDGADIKDAKVPGTSIISLMDILQNPAHGAPPEAAVDLERDISLLIFTSGTTGLPKGAMITFMGALYKAVSTAMTYYWHEHVRFLCTQPCYHIAGMTLMNGHFYYGGTMYMLTRFDAELIMQAIEKYKCDSWYGSAIMNKDILSHPNRGKYNLSYLRMATTTSFGIQLTSEMADAWEVLTNGGQLLEIAYGLSESHTMDTLTPPEHPKYGTCGAPIYREMNVRILDDEGNTCPVGVIGEITLKNPAIFKGYFNNPEATAEVLKDGWLFTGDIGKIDEEGYLCFLGRKKEMIKTSGYSVFPEEVELYVCKHEAVSQAIVIGKPDARRGEAIKAFVVLKPDYVGKVAEEEIIAWAKDKMAAYKCPREIEFRTSLPTTGTGKLLRRVLREEEAKKSGDASL
jgi:long-chain acyl-CoA synthetase